MSQLSRASHIPSLTRATRLLSFSWSAACLVSFLLTTWASQSRRQSNGCRENWRPIRCEAHLLSHRVSRPITCTRRVGISIKDVPDLRAIWAGEESVITFISTQVKPSIKPRMKHTRCSQAHSCHVHSTVRDPSYSTPSTWSDQ
jgi:hypothetical protein